MEAMYFSHVTCSYAQKTALNQISLTIPGGEVLGLVGRNGAGKTTLIRAAMGMLRPQSGEIRILGLSPIEESVLVKERVGYVSEDQILPPFLKTIEVMSLYKSLFPKTWDDRLARELAGTFNLPVDQKIKALSKGQARQVALVCAVAHKPELLILDEPAGGLDPSARREFLETSIAFLNECGSTILFSSHHMSDVERMSSRILLIHEGQITLDRSMDELKEDYTLVLIPEVEGIDRDRLKKVEGCISIRRKNEVFHTVFNQPKEKIRAHLEQELGLRGLHSKSMGLEELFIEVTGGQ